MTNNNQSDKDRIKVLEAACLDALRFINNPMGPDSGARRTKAWDAILDAMPEASLVMRKEAEEAFNKPGEKERRGF